MKERRKWSEKATIEKLNRSKIGIELASKVAKKLLKDKGRKGIWYTHRDYCGHGLISIDDNISLVEVHDGDPLDGKALLSWKSESDFISWLARQSDFSLSGADPDEKELFSEDSFGLNNQRLTAERLTEYVKGPTKRFW